jgi:polyisoprenyl-phosphate glycosyltransferase
MLASLQNHFSFQRTEIGIVIPVFNEALVLESLSEELIEELSGYSFQILFVDDGSTDETWSKVVNLSIQHVNINGIRLKRNLGQMKSILLGILVLNSDWIGVMDGDGQNPPKVMRKLLELRSQDFVVAGVKRDRINSIYRRLITDAFYFLISSFGRVPRLSNTGEFRVFHRSTLQMLLPHLKADSILRFTFAGLGIKEIPVNYDLPKRQFGKTKYTLLKRLKIVIDSAFQVHNRPQILLANFLVIAILGFVSSILLLFFISSKFGSMFGVFSIFLVVIILLLFAFLIGLVCRRYVALLSQNDKGLELNQGLILDWTRPVINE